MHGRPSTSTSSATRTASSRRAALHRSALLRLVKDDEKLSGVWLRYVVDAAALCRHQTRRVGGEEGDEGVRPKEWRPSEPQPLSCTKRYVEYFRIPVVKRALRNTLFCAYTAPFSLVVFSRGEHATLVDAFADARHHQIETLFAPDDRPVVDELHQFHSMEHYFNSVWNQLDLCAYSLPRRSPRGGSPPRRPLAAGRRLHPGGGGGGGGVGGGGDGGGVRDGDDMLRRRRRSSSARRRSRSSCGSYNNFKHTSNWVSCW